MKNPSELEEAALIAAFSFADAIDTINKFTRNPPSLPHSNWPIGENSSPSAIQRARSRKNTKDPWKGWTFRGDELNDSGGNRYAPSEIRAIYYTRKLLWHYETLERSRRPVINRDPVQLSFTAVLPAWKVFATR